MSAHSVRGLGRGTRSLQYVLVLEARRRLLEASEIAATPTTAAEVSAGTARPGKSTTANMEVGTTCP